MKTVTDNQLNGELGETLVKAAFLKLGHVFEGRGRLETGIDGTVEFRDPTTGRMLGKTVGAQVKTRAKDAYTRESDTAFEYLLRPSDLEYWRGSNLPVVIVLFRLSDETFFWKDVTACVGGEERRLAFDKVLDRLDEGSMDRLAQLSVERGRLGSFVPPMRIREPAHLNLMAIDMPDEIFVAESPFRSGRDAIPTLLKGEDRRFDWVIRGKRFISFRDPRGTAVESIVEPDTLEAVDTKHVTTSDDHDDEVCTVELLRRTLQEQFVDDLAFDNDSRSFYFRPLDPLMPRVYRYRSLKEQTTATVVQLYPDKRNPKRLNNVRHHAFVPRFERIVDDWYLSITPTFFFTENGGRPHPHASSLLAGKKRLDRNGSIRGQVFLWRHFLADDPGNETGMTLFDLPDNAARVLPLLRFRPLPPVTMDLAVPEDAWVTSDPDAKRLEVQAEDAPSLLLGART